MSTLYYTSVDDGEHFTEVDTFKSLFDATCSYYTLINDGPIDGETRYEECELGAYLNVDTEEMEMEGILFHTYW